MFHQFLRLGCYNLFKSQLFKILLITLNYLIDLFILCEVIIDVSLQSQQMNKNIDRRDDEEWIGVIRD